MAPALPAVIEGEGVSDTSDPSTLPMESLDCSNGAMARVESGAAPPLLPLPPSAPLAASPAVEPRLDEGALGEPPCGGMAARL